MYRFILFGDNRYDLRCTLAFKHPQFIYILVQNRCQDRRQARGRDQLQLFYKAIWGQWRYKRYDYI